MSIQNSDIISYKEFLTKSTKPVVRPSVWKWEDIKSNLYGELSKGFAEEDKGTVSLINKDTGDANGVSPNINALVQVLKPGQHNESHKHSNMALFLVFQGEGYSIIDGEKIEWAKGDLLYAPAWLEHEHCNTSEHEDAILYTIQDVPHVSGMGTWFLEEPVGTGTNHVVKEKIKSKK